jgi:hypothetical protein
MKKDKQQSLTLTGGVEETEIVSLSVTYVLKLTFILHPSPACGNPSGKFCFAVHPSSFILQMSVFRG